MGGYVKWEEVEELLNLHRNRNLFNDYTLEYQKYTDALNIKTHELKNSVIYLPENKNYSITINLHNNEKSAREFADELAKQIKLKGGIL